VYRPAADASDPHPICAPARPAKRGGGDLQVTLTEETAAQPPRPSAEESLNDALVRLRRYHPRTHLIVEMHYRFGSTAQEIAEAVCVSVRTVERELSFGRGWLEGEIKGEYNHDAAGNC
jgi:DNA-directed RNA polymerase specialized sigma24 family protein